MENLEMVQSYLDVEGKITVWPGKRKYKELIVQYLASKFEIGVEYTEKEVNEIIDQWHTFNDYFLLRRSLIDYRYMKRTRDGAKYWKENA